MRKLITMKEAMVLLLMIGLYSCIQVDEVSIDDWKPEVAIAVLQTQVSIEDFLEETEAAEYLSEQSDQFLTLAYKQQVYESTAEDFIEVYDFTLAMQDTLKVFSTDQFPFEFRLDFLALKGGALQYDIQSQHEDNLTIRLEIANLKQNETPFIQEFELAYPGSLPVEYTRVIPLTDYSINFIEEFTIRYSATNSAGERVLLENVAFTFKDLQFQYAEGNFESVSFGLQQDSFLLDLIERPSTESFFFENPQLTFTIENSVGVPISARALSLLAHTEKEGIIPFESVLSEGVTVGYPTFDQRGMAITTKLIFNKGNSNLVEIANALPTRLDYQLEGTLFPDNGNSNFRGYAMDTSFVKADMLLEIPLWGRVSKLKYEIENEFTPPEENPAEYLELKLIIDNGFPVEVDLQVFFEDDAGNVLTTLPEADEFLKIEPAAVNNQEVTGATSSILTLIMAADKLAAIQSASQIRLEASISTPNDGSTSVRFFSDYELGIKVGAKIIPQ